MKHIFLVFAGCVLLFAAVSCDGEELPEIHQGQSSPAIVREALSAMEGLRSYRLEMLFDEAEGQPVVIEFAAPDSYHFLVYDVRTTDGEEEIEGVDESIMVGDKAYTRRCKDIDEECGPWQQGSRPPVPAAGSSPEFLPGWPLVALEMAQDLQIIGTEKRDGVATTHLRGAVNQLRAILENERRALTDAGITSFGERCREQAEGELVCSELTFEQLLEEQEPTLNFYDENPSTTDVWVSEDSLVRRIEFQIPPQEAEDQEIIVAFGYSRFNEVVIEAPE